MLRFGDVQKLRRTYVKDISKGGMFVRSRRPQSVGSRVQVVLELPDGSRFPLLGEVVSVRDSADGTGGNGVRFTDLDPGRLAMLESYIDACAAGVPQPLLNDDSDISLVNVIEPEVEQKLQSAISQVANRLPAAALEQIGAPLKTPSADVLLRLDVALREVERLSSGNPYDVLGVEPEASSADVREVLAGRLAEFSIDSDLGRMPARLTTRIQSAKAKLQMAATTLLDASARAALDIEQGFLRPATEEAEVQDAFETELRRRRDRATQAERDEFALAEPFVELAQQKQEVGDLRATRSLLRAALLYDPHNLGIREAAARVRDELRKRHPPPPPRPVRAVASDEPAATAADSPTPAEAASAAPEHGLPPPPRAAALQTGANERPTTERLPATESGPEGLDADSDPASVAFLEPEEELGPPRNKSRVALISVIAGLAVGGVVAAVIVGGGFVGGEDPSAEPVAVEEKAEPPAEAGESGADSEPAAGGEVATGTGGEEAEAEPTAEEAGDPEGESEGAVEAEEPGEDAFAEVKSLLEAGEFDAAYAKADELRKGGHENGGYRYMTVARCHQKDGIRARKAYHRLVGKNTRKIVRERCDELGIDVTAKTKGATPREMYYRAQEAEEAGDHKRACYLAINSNYKEPSADAMVMAGGCACRSGKKGKAEKLLRLLPPDDRPRLLEKCKALGVEL